jgi:hypothetical protein
VFIAHPVNIPQSPKGDTCGQTAIFPNDACAKTDCTTQQTKRQHPADRLRPISGTTTQHADAHSNGGGLQGISY